MNFKPILIFIVVAAILSVSIVAAYENVEYNSNNVQDESSHSKINYPSRHHTHKSYDAPKNDFTVDGYLSSLFT